MAPQLFLLGLQLISFLMFTDAQQIGVCNGQLGNNLPSDQQVIDLFRSNGITRMRLYGPNPDTLRALNDQPNNIELMLDVPNDNLERLNNPSAATTWVRDNIQNYPRVHFRYIAVGNEVDPNKDTQRYVRFVLPAMRNTHAAIVAARLGNQIKVSTATYTGLLNNSFPPSQGTFPENVNQFMRPIIAFLVQNNLPMLANIYPYFAARDNQVNVPLAYALFRADARPVVDSNNGLRYNNLFDAMLDAHYAAQSRLGGDRLEIVVSESGWPSSGHAIATMGNAGTYYRNLIAHVKRNRTPARPTIPINAYLFAMFDENTKPGLESERFFGVFRPDQQSKYNLSF